MRLYTEPPPVIRCEACGGELRLKQNEMLNPVDVRGQVMICAACGREQLLIISPNTLRT